jgi:ketosteroid isomerase-like protein
MAMYADDAVTMMPNVPKAVGKAAIAEVFTALTQAMTVKAIDFRTDEVMVQGDVAIEIGGFTMTAQPKKGAEIKDTGKYITVWKKQADGSWKIIRDITNSDGPPAPAK